VPILQARLAKEGIRTVAITGQTEPRDRARIVADFQLDSSQASDFSARVEQDNDINYLESGPTRILIFTSVGTAGINLFRANEMILVDHFFTDQEITQAIGRIARKGQTRKCIVRTITVHRTADDWMYGLATSKGLAVSALFGRIAQVQVHAEEGEVWRVGHDNILKLHADTRAAIKSDQVKAMTNAEEAIKTKLQEKAELPEKKVVDTTK